MFSTLALLSVFPAFALGTVYTTSPVGGTTFQAGQPATISWQDDSKSPSLSDFGDAKVSIYVGNALQQTPLQVVVDSVNVASTSSIQFTPDASVGPNSGEYFVRFESLNLKDSGSPQYPALAFSAKFTMSGMSGTFNSTVQSQIDGQSTAPIATPTGSSGSATAGATSAKTTSAVKTATGSAVSASSSAKSNGASSAFTMSSQWIAVSCAAIFGFALF